MSPYHSPDFPPPVSDSVNFACKPWILHVWNILFPPECNAVSLRCIFLLPDGPTRQHRHIQPLFRLHECSSLFSYRFTLQLITGNPVLGHSGQCVASTPPRHPTPGQPSSEFSLCLDPHWRTTMPSMLPWHLPDSQRVSTQLNCSKTSEPWMQSIVQNYSWCHVQRN
ncbi:hypothetical protein BDV19DRAFT_349063 [Aspergillus venezuelensis]